MQGLSVRDADVRVRNTIKTFQIVFKGFHFGLVFMRHNTKMCQLNSANVRNCHAALYSFCKDGKIVNTHNRTN